MANAISLKQPYIAGLDKPQAFMECLFYLLRYRAGVKEECEEEQQRYTSRQKFPLGQPVPTSTLAQEETERRKRREVGIRTAELVIWTFVVCASPSHSDFEKRAEFGDFTSLSVSVTSQTPRDGETYFEVVVVGALEYFLVHFLSS
ncbi:hypothetical protein WN55_00249 [Dufourea novaeangliae]|uniref:Uncharacterized protein n=1 Tax=Dufourea novaeangliae TaxID=178035 RepID=A0A154PCR6_DUFNO|nr:hypothetical protein WN55_00249 [Dufourea novaeangliae]